MIMNDFLRIWQIDCNPGIQYNTIQYNTIQYNTIQYNTIIILNFLNYLYLIFLIALRNIKFILNYDLNCFFP